MKLVYPEINAVLDTDKPGIQTLVIESPRFLRELLSDIYRQLNGETGNAVLSTNNKPLEMSKYAEVLDNFISFEINQKPLLNKIASALEKKSTEEEYYMKTERVMHELELLFDDLAFELPGDIVCSKLNIASVIKGVAPELRDDYEDYLERIIDYIELVREFDRDKLFITLDLRSFFTDEEAETFILESEKRHYNLLMIESCDRTRLPCERRLTIDADLCEF